MKKRKKKRRLRKGFLVLVLGILLLLTAGASFYLYKQIQGNKTSPYFLAGSTQMLELRNEDNETLNFPRGFEVQIKNKTEEIDGVEYRLFTYNNKTYYVLDSNLELDRNNSVKESTLYALRDHVLTEAVNDYHISGWIKKKQEVQVTGFNQLLEDGSVDYYYVDNTGYIKSEFLSDSFYETGYDSSIYNDVFYGMAGSPTVIDYYPKQIPSFEDNVMPDVVKALYINAEAICDAQYFIELARKTSGINAFVVDIKDCYVDTQLAYNSPVALKYAPSTENIPNTFEEYKENIKKLKDAGYYLIGRITAFKDDAFAADNPEESLMEANGDRYTYGYVKWPSVYSRKMWEYNLALASEAVNEFGFNEIQFDYIRFPEDDDDTLITRNIYDETRAQVVTNFLRYASEYLHDQGVYVSADVFGETSGDEDDEFSCFVAYYGQFWPAVSNAVDVISSMPYPDHFGDDYYGISSPWSNPGPLMYSWGRATYYAQEKTYDPAKCRTWIMAQNSDVYDVVYDESFLADQINSLKSAGVFDGYMTWNAASSLSKYGSYIDVLD